MPQKPSPTPLTDFTRVELLGMTLADVVGKFTQPADVVVVTDDAGTPCRWFPPPPAFRSAASASRWPTPCPASPGW